METGKHTLLKRLLLLSGALLVLLVAIVVIASVWWDWRASGRLDRALIALEAREEPVTLEQIQELYTTEGLARNAAPIYLAAAKRCECAMKETGSQLPALPIVGTGQLPALGERLPNDMARRIERFLSGQKEALLKVEEARPIKDSVYEGDLTAGAAFELPHLKPLRDLARVLALQALMQIQRGDLDACAQTIADQLKLAASLKREPACISQLVRIALEDIALETLERMLSFGSPSPERSAELSRLLADQVDVARMRMPVLHQRAMAVDILRQMGSGTLEESVREADGSRILLWLGRGRAKDESVWCLERLNEMVDTTRLSPLEASRKAKEVDDRIEAEGSKRRREISVGWSPAGLLLPSLSGIHEQAIVANTRLSMARVALAIESFRRETGRLPQTLQELVPKYLDALPKDVFSGSRLRYVLDENGYRVYSVGPDGNDDGGTQDRNQGNTDADVIFEVRR